MKPFHPGICSQKDYGANCVSVKASQIQTYGRKMKCEILLDKKIKIDKANNE